MHEDGDGVLKYQLLELELGLGLGLTRSRTPYRYFSNDLKMTLMLL